MKTEVRSLKAEARIGETAKRRNGEHVRLWSRRLGVSPFPRLILILLSTLSFQLSTAFAQQYSIDWFTIDGGGGTSTGGVYSVTGTIGQPDAGTMSGGNYTLDGGFWGIIAAVQTPGAPLLTIFRTTTNTVVVSWPSPSTSFNLQVNTNLASTNWSSAGSPFDNGTNRFIIVSPPTGNRFYRLANP